MISIFFLIIISIAYRHLMTPHGELATVQNSDELLKSYLQSISSSLPNEFAIKKCESLEGPVSRSCNLTPKARHY
jgi:hypothetical protein